MLALMARESADVVYGQRVARAGETWFKKLTAHAFYRLLGWLADAPIPRDTGDFRLMTRRVLDQFLAMPERHRFVRGMVSWIGFKQVPYRYERQPRAAGQTHYTLGKMLRFAGDAVTGFSVKPLALPAAGRGRVPACAAAATWLLAGWWGLARGEVPTAGLLAGLMLLLAGGQFVALGVMGEYLGPDVRRGPRPAAVRDRAGGPRPGGGGHAAGGAGRAAAAGGGVRVSWLGAASVVLAHAFAVSAVSHCHYVVTPPTRQLWFIAELVARRARCGRRCRWAVRRVWTVAREVALDAARRAARAGAVRQPLVGGPLADTLWLHKPITRAVLELVLRVADWLVASAVYAGLLALTIAAITASPSGEGSRELARLPLGEGAGG